MSSQQLHKTSYRVQHLLPATLVLALSALVVWLSYTREPSDAFLFPRLISSVMLILAVWNFIRAASGASRVGTGLSGAVIKAIAPGLCILFLYVFFAAKAIGFYVASYIAFFCLYSVYDPASHKLSGTWIRRLLITTLFMVVIYALFSLLLKVQTPRGLFF